MMKDLFLEIITPEQLVFSQPVGLVEVPGAKGRFTLLRNHAPIVSVLVAGKIRVVSKTGTEYQFECKSGFIECENNKATILSDNITII
jgi:F-type H+-transporting ATPase subunit epsilon